MTRGWYFEDFDVGQHFRHALGRTVSEADDTMFSLMTMNQHPIHIDEHFAASTQHGRRLVVGPLVMAIVIGLSQSDIGYPVRTMEYADVRHEGPVFHGDTLYAESTVIAKDEERDSVTVESRGLNQRGEPVLSMKRTFVAVRRRAA